MIPDVNIRNLDLNLLVLFDALIAEGNLTRAAQQVGLSQPAMSNALARLRSQLGDPLFVRHQRGLRPTDRARLLATPVHRALAELADALALEPFDPATSRRSFTLMMNDIHEIVLGPRLSARVSKLAPGIDLRSVQGPSVMPDQALSAGDVDIVISPIERETPHTHHERLYTLGFSSLVRPSHPCLGRRLTLERFVAMDHVLVAPRGKPGGILDELLAQMGLRRRVVRMVAHFMSALLVVRDSDFIVTLPSILADAMAPIFGLRVIRVPLEIPSVAIGQFWSSRSHADAGHRWLRAIIVETARAASASGSSDRGRRSRANPRSR
jgi:DNA-binding transcriptional LysR family regulator